jgi:hypothetical protein
MTTARVDHFKLFIWRERILPDYTSGIAFAAARNTQEAIEAILETADGYEKERLAGELMTQEPDVLDLPAGGFMGGGS